MLIGFKYINFIYFQYIQKFIYKSIKIIILIYSNIKNDLLTNSIIFIKMYWILQNLFLNKA